jgi:outer membrane immunogenic protein
MRVFRAVLPLIAGALGLAATAANADGPARRGHVDDVSYAPVSWSGFYAGLHAGGAWADADWQLQNGATVERFSHSPRSGIFGGQVGLQHQWGHVVAGVEVSLSGFELRDDSGAGNPLLTDRVRETGIENIFLATAKLGYAADRWLVYGKGGFASADVTFTGFGTAPGIASFSSEERENGWTAGGGFEYMFWRNVSFGLEYNFIRLDTSDRLSTRFSNGNPAPISQVGDTDVHVVMARLNFLFGRDEPVVRPMK